MVTQDQATKTRLGELTGSELAESVRRGLARFEAGEITASQLAKGLSKLVTALERIDAQCTVKAEDVREVFAWWLRETGRDPRKARLTPERDRKVRGRLREGYSVMDIKVAISNLARSAFHSGENENGRQYNDLTLVCRSGSQLESYRDMGPVTAQTLNQQRTPSEPLLAAPGAAERSYKQVDW